MPDTSLTWNDVVDWLKTLGDWTSVAITIGAIADLLPPIAALFGIIYWMIRIYESDTVQQLLVIRRIRRSKKEGDDGEDVGN